MGYRVAMREHPRHGDRVWDGNRAKSGLQPYGTVFSIDQDWEDRDNGEAMVEFDTVRNTFSRHVLLCDGQVNYDCRSAAFKLVFPHKWEYVVLSNPSAGSGDVETYDFDEFNGNWSSHEHGDGLWSLG